jgi:hypothetical protein
VPLLPVQPTREIESSVAIWPRRLALPPPGPLHNKKLIKEVIFVTLAFVTLATLVEGAKSTRRPDGEGEGRRVRNQGPIVNIYNSIFSCAITDTLCSAAKRHFGESLFLFG